MPELDIGDGKEVPDWRDSLRVWAVMCYPNDPKQQEVYEIRCAAQMMIQSSADDEAIATDLAELLAPIGGFRALSDGPSYTDIEHRTARQVIGGTTAGDILANIMRLDLYDYGGSVRKAIRAMETYYTKREQHQVEPQLPGKFPTKRSAIIAAWSEFKPVAHLWAAHRSVDSQAHQLTPFPPANLPVFLATAELYRSFGESHHPHGQKTPTLPPAETLRVRPSFPLPEIKKLSVRPVTDAQVEAAGIKIRKSKGS